MELRLIYFPPHRFPAPRVVRAGDLTVVTDAATCEEAALRDHLAALERILTGLPLGPATQPASQPATRPTSQPASQPATRPSAPTVTAALYARRESFRALWHRVGVYYDGQFVGIADAGGYSYRPFCATFLDAAAPRAIPPELSHEIAHVWLWSRAGLPNDGNWLAEGLATAIQLRLSPAPDQRRAWAERVRTGRFVPLKRLMTTAPLDARHYWQAATLVETLLAHHGDRLGALIQAVADGREAHAIVTEVLATTWLTLDRRWRAHVADVP